jgi:hypothetical protein
VQSTRKPHYELPSLSCCTIFHKSYSNQLSQRHDGLKSLSSQSHSALFSTCRSSERVTECYLVVPKQCRYRSRALICHPRRLPCACIMIVCSYLHISHRSKFLLRSLQICRANLCNLGSGNRIIVQTSQDNTADRGKESIDPHANPHGLGVVRVQLVMLPCSNHGCNVVED